MNRSLAVFAVIISVSAGSAQAFLPPDASAREPQIRAYRQQVREKYEKRLVERQAEAVQAYEQTRADVFTPPWMRSETRTALRTEVNPSPSGKTEAVVKRNHRLLVSIVLLILIGAAAGWVHYATREKDE
jgi:hypothetical protein